MSLDSLLVVIMVTVAACFILIKKFFVRKKGKGCGSCDCGERPGED